MSNDIIESPKAYWTREVADLLDIKEGTVRKYSRLMEDFGYHFHKNENEQRGFFESDVLIMKRIQSLSKTKGVTLEDAVSAVLSTHYKPSQEIMTPPVMDFQVALLRNIERHYDLIESINTLKKDNEDLKNEVKKISQQFTQQQSYIDERLKTRDEMLVDSLRNLLKEKEKNSKGFINWFRNLGKQKV